MFDVAPRFMRALGCATMLLAALAAICRVLPPPALPTRATATEFSAERAVEHLRIIARQPRPTGSAANDIARGYILRELERLGLEAETQRVGTLANVVAKMVGTRSVDAVLLTAHLDSAVESPGAADDGSGVAVLLETARALASNGPSPNTVMFLFTDFEEGGTVGARAFISGHPWARDVRIVIGLDAGGLRGPGLLSATSAHNGWLIRQLAQADSYLVGNSAINTLAESSTDFGLSFKPAGFSGYEFDLYWDKRIHTPEDNIENLSLASLQHQGYHALLLARHLGGLGTLADLKEPDAVYFNILRLFTITYPSTWATLMALAVAGLYGGVLALGLRTRILTWRGVGYGAFVLVAALVLAPVPSLLFVGRATSKVFGFVGPPWREPVQVGIAALLALALTIAWYYLARQLHGAGSADFTMGALAPMVVGMAGTAVMLPTLSFVFTWPLLLSLLACVNWFYWHARRRNSMTVVPVLLLAGVANIVILAPTVLLGLFDQMPLPLALLGVLCGYLVPLIHYLLGGTIETLQMRTAS